MIRFVELIAQPKDVNLNFIDRLASLQVITSRYDEITMIGPLQLALRRHGDRVPVAQNRTRQCL